MSVRFLEDDGYVALYDSVTMTAFGPIIGESDDRLMDATEMADAFLDWLRDDGPAPKRELCLARNTHDARLYADEELHEHYARFLADRELRVLTGRGGHDRQD